MKKVTSWINRRYGSKHGLLRLMISSCAIGHAKLFLQPGQLRGVQRLVFVCMGNICRSALAEAVAVREGVDAISFGLDTDGDAPADSQMQHAALQKGYDLSAHRSTPIASYIPNPGDLVVLMQPEHRKVLVMSLPMDHMAICLLGSWATRPIRYIHDPYNADTLYILRCTHLIEDATRKLCNDLRNNALPVDEDMAKALTMKQPC